MGSRYQEDDYLFASPANARTWMLQGDLWEEEPTHRNKYARIFVGVISGLLVLCGIALAVIGRVQEDENLLPLCPHCDDLIVALYIIGSAVSLIGVVGIIAAISRSRIMAAIYTVILTLVTLAMLAAGVAVIVYRGRSERSDLHGLWKDAVRRDPNFICQFQSQFKCSGYLMCCGPDCIGTVIADCVETCENNDTYEKPCADAVQSEVRQHLAEILAAFFGFAFLFILTIIGTVRMVLKG